MEDDVMLGRMNGARRRGRPRKKWLDTLMGYSSGATISNMRRYSRDRAGWRGPARLSPGVGCDSTAQGNKATFRSLYFNVNVIYYMCIIMFHAIIVKQGQLVRTVHIAPF